MVRFLIRRIAPRHPGDVDGHRPGVRHLLRRPRPRQTWPAAWPGRNATPQTVQLIRSACTSTSRSSIQYWDFLKQLVWHHNLGLLLLPPAAGRHRPQAGVPDHASPWRIGAAVIWLVLGVLSGVLSAVRRGSIWDRSATDAGPVLLLDADVRARA